MILNHISIFCIVMAVFLPKTFTNSVENIPPNVRERMLATVRGNLKDISEEGTVPNSEITWNPIEITDNPLLAELCWNNVPGNYENPFNCSQFIMCEDDGSVYLGVCSAVPGTGLYDPLRDQCTYPYFPPDFCSWKTTFEYQYELNCENVGQRPYWGWLTLPQDRDVTCGEFILYCGNSTQLGINKCPPGCGYSKAYLGCLPLDKCMEVDNYFGL